MRIRPRYSVPVAVVLLAAAALWLIARMLNSLPLDAKRAIVEIRRVVAVRDVPESAYPPPSGENWFGSVPIPAHREPGDIFILIETNGGQGEIEWSVSSKDARVSHGASFILGKEGTRYYLVRTIVEPDPVCESSARAFTLEARARAQQTDTEAHSVFHAQWEGTCDNGAMKLVDGSLPFNPSLTYSACISGGRCRTVDNK